MANTASAKKAIRVAERRAIINSKKRKNFKGARKEVLKAVEAKDKKTAENLLAKAYKEIDKAAKTNIIHKNTAARYKSRLTAKVKSL